MTLKETDPQQQPVFVLTRKGLRKLVVAVGVVIVALIFLVHPGQNGADTGTDGQSSMLSALSGHSTIDQNHALRVGGKHHLYPPEQDSYTAMVVMGRMEKEAEEMAWVNDKLKNITGSHIYIVDNPLSSLPHLDKNHGREARVYLEYIVSQYDNLSDVTFFWHVSEKVWHNNILLDWDSVQTINRMDRGNIIRQGYVPSRCDTWPGCPAWVKFNPSQAEHQLDPHRLSDMFNPQLFGQLFPGETDFPPYFAGTCCSQFAVSRDAIRSRPIEHYKVLLTFITNYESDQQAGMVFELLWPYIFLKTGTLCPSMTDCYCKTYNLCLEDPTEIREIEEWNGWRGRRDELSWQVNYLEDKYAEKVEAAKKFGMTLEPIENDEELGPEMKRVDAEFARLRDKVKFKQDALVAYWKLSESPVDW